MLQTHLSVATCALVHNCDTRGVPRIPRSHVFPGPAIQTLPNLPGVAICAPRIKHSQTCRGRHHEHLLAIATRAVAPQIYRVARVFRARHQSSKFAWVWRHARLIKLAICVTGHGLTDPHVFSRLDSTRRDQTGWTRLDSTGLEKTGHDWTRLDKTRLASLDQT